METFHDLDSCTLLEVLDHTEDSDGYQEYKPVEALRKDPYLCRLTSASYGCWISVHCWLRNLVNTHQVCTKTSV